MIGVRFGITNPRVEDYVYRMLRPRNHILRRMEQYAERLGVPIVGPAVGQFLYQIALVSRSKRILEFGTAIGYSTSWFARAAMENHGKVTTIELDQNIADKAMENLKEQGLDAYVKLLVGDAVEVAGKLEQRFDLVFIDADKPDYPTLLEEAMRLLKKGGVLVADNTLWSGAVATDDSSMATVSLKRFNEKVLSDKSLDSVILPLRDGVTFAVKR